MKQHEVIRTKAVKCSKAVNVNIPFFTNDYNNLDPNFENTNIASDSALNVDINSIDFLVDFDINELLASDDSIPDFHQIHQQVDENGDHHNIYGKCEINGFNLVDEVNQIHEYSKSVDEAGLDVDDFFQQASTERIMDLPSFKFSILFEFRRS
ncbi:transcription factor TT2 [Corchorus olitorius]|uniref:Transcription factor TT2 n=1 Tax=Corchorus olitorius TaxID=93759 RepID=A0A1R3JA91_9ROSI|nr:transcription factor TT2 [Corchorus olitorius]